MSNVAEWAFSLKINRRSHLPYIMFIKFKSIFVCNTLHFRYKYLVLCIFYKYVPRIKRNKHGLGPTISKFKVNILINSFSTYIEDRLFCQLYSLLAKEEPIKTVVVLSLCVLSLTSIQFNERKSLYLRQLTIQYANKRLIFIYVPILSLRCIKIDMYLDTRLFKIGMVCSLF